MAALAGESGGGRETVGDWVRGLAARYGDTEAFVGDSGRLTYRQLDQLSARWGRGLLARGVTKGSRIGLWLGNRAEWLVAFCAVARVGAVAVPLSTFFREHELGRVVRHADLQGLFVHPSFLRESGLDKTAAAIAGLGERTGPGFFLPAAPYLRWVVAVDGVGPGDQAELPPWACPIDWLAGAADDGAVDDAVLFALEAEVFETDPAVMIYTSGSTADPKGVPHTQETVVRKSRLLRQMLPVKSGVRSYIASPFFWVGGITMSLFPVLEAGGTQFCTDRFDPGEVLALIERERIERAVLYPHHVEALLAHPGLAQADRSSLVEADPRLLVGSAAEVTPDPEALRVGLGMTETFDGYWWGRPVRGGPHLRPGERRPPPLDWLIPGHELKVVGPDGAPVGDGERGEIRIRGWSVTRGQYKVPVERTLDPDGFLRTGDEGEVDGERVHFIGRMGEMIKTAGANVSPAEVAVALRELDGVDEAYVVGLPDPVRGQLVVAAVVPEDGAEVDPERLRAELRDSLSVFKVPARIEVFAREDIPWTPSHKVRLNVLADMIRHRTGGSPT